MNYEESRLRTFRNWPSDAKPEPQRIANGGFFYTGQGKEVQCFACGGKISEWKEGDHVMTKHRRLDPRCPFIVNPITSGNVPKFVQPPEEVNLAILRGSAQARLSTYTDWPIPDIVTPTCLSDAGFYWLQEGDKVKCAFCNGIVGFWEVGDDPKSEHERHFPYCKLVLSNFNPNLTAESEVRCVGNSEKELLELGIQAHKGANHPECGILDPRMRSLPRNRVELNESRDKNLTAENEVKCVQNSEKSLSDLGIHAHKGPKHPDFATIESRMRSFTNWPVELIQTPDLLSEAGFYYVGSNDQVRCFHCDGGLRHWDPDDEPWVEHARWFPNCAFLSITKGSEFIKTCAVSEEETDCDNRPKRSLRTSRKVCDAEVQALMSSEPVLAALSIGIDLGRVKNALRIKLENSGVGFSSADSLIEAALNLEVDDLDFADAETSDEIFKMLSSVLATKEGIVGEGVQGGQDNGGRTSGRDSQQVVSLQEENRILKEARLCKICMDKEIGVVFLPCGHLSTCISCAPSLKDCPVCRSVIKATVRTFLS